jgi:hypothetical protein
MSNNKFLSFGRNGINSNSSSTFIIGATSKIQSIEIKANDENIILPDPNAVDYDVIQYRKTITTAQDVVFTYKNRQIGVLYSHRNQSIKFHKFNSANPGWIS